MPALNFNGSFMRVEIPTALQNLDTQTWVFWVNPNSATTQNRRIWWRGDNAGNSLSIMVGRLAGGDGRIDYIRDRATTATNVRTGSNVYTAGNWYFLVITDQAGVTPRIYLGTPTTPPVDSSTIVAYHQQTTGVGAATNNSAFTPYLGNTTISVSSHWANARIAYAAAYSRILSVGEMTMLWAEPWMVLPNCALMLHPGMWGGNGFNQPDLSGNELHGSVTDTPPVVDGPPIAEPVFYTIVPMTLPPAAAGSPVNITGTQGTVPVVGQTATTRLGSNITGTQGTVAVVGQTATTRLGSNITGTQGTVPVVGQVATTRLGSNITGTQGTVPVVGQVATITSGLTVVGTQGAVAVVGQAAAVTSGLSVNGTQGTIVLVGQTATISVGANVTGTQGTIALVGQTATISVGANLLVTQGLIPIVGQAAGISVGPGVSGTQGLIPIVGQVAAVSLGALGPSRSTLARNAQTVTLVRASHGTNLVRGGN